MHALPIGRDDSLMEIFVPFPELGTFGGKNLLPEVPNFFLQETLSFRNQFKH